MGKRVSLRKKVDKSLHSDKTNKMDVTPVHTSKLRISVKMDSIKKGNFKLLSKRDKKHIKKRVWDDRLKRAASKTQHKKQAKKKKIQSTPLVHNLNSLFDAIREIESETVTSAPKPRPSKALTSKQRKKMLALESERFRKVQQHPRFKADPIGSITEHLRNEMSRKT